MTTPVASIRWRRQDVPGDDACRLLPDGEGWMLIGKAAYVEKEIPYRFAYRVQCDAGWRTVACRLRGAIDGRAIRWDYRRDTKGDWKWNHCKVAGLDAGLDLDLGFSPATNLAQLRRLNLAVGEAADMPVAWLNPEDGSLSFLPQHYRRLSDSSYAYESPTVGYAETLEVDPESGFALRYPGLWVAVDEKCA